MSDDDDLVTVTRTGGFAGLTLTTTIDLAQVPEPARTTWRTALESRVTNEAASTTPDEFTYRLEHHRTATDVRIPEHALPPALRALLATAVQPGEGPAAGGQTG